MRHKAVIFLFSILLFHNCSAQKAIVQPLRILVLGNSTLYHQPDLDLGWDGDWGMAASAANKDYQSILRTKLQANPKYDVQFFSQNIALWEKDFNFDLNTFQAITDQKYDLVILRLGENVAVECSNFSNYKAALQKLISRFAKPYSKVILTGLLWPSSQKETIVKELAKEQGYGFIPMEEFRKNAQNFAFGLYKNPQVAAHPSDQGMKVLANLLYDKIEEIYF